MGFGLDRLFPYLSETGRERAGRHENIMVEVAIGFLIPVPAIPVTALSTP